MSELDLWRERMDRDADFYDGMEWLGSVRQFGYPGEVPSSVTEAKTRQEYRDAVAAFVDIKAEQGWPWDWENSRYTNYSYTFSGGVVYVTRYGRGWVEFKHWAKDMHGPHWMSVRDRCIFPSMREQPVVAYVADDDMDVDDDNDGDVCVYQSIIPARAVTKATDNLWGNPSWVAEEKLDGWRFLMHFGARLPRTYMTGRRFSDVTGLLSEKGLCAPTLWPQINGEIGYTVIDGEVMPPTGSNRRELAGIMNVTPDHAAERVMELGTPSYHAFDILYHDGEDVRDLPFHERRMMLYGLMNDLNNPNIQLVEQRTSNHSVYDEIVARGGEGVVLKDIYAPYGSGWVKVKHVSTVDVIVTGFKDGRGKYEGMVGAVRVSVRSSTGALLEVGAVSGMTDDVRRDMSINPDRWLGSVIEIIAQGFAKLRLQHPRFLRARPEANPLHATFAKLKHDLGDDDDRPEQIEEQTTFEF